MLCRTFVLGSERSLLVRIRLGPLGWVFTFDRFFSRLNSSSPSTATGRVPLFRRLVVLLASLGRRSTGRVDLLGPPYEFDVHRGASNATSLSKSPIERKDERERSRFETRRVREWRNSGEIGDEWTNPNASAQDG